MRNKWLFVIPILMILLLANCSDLGVGGGGGGVTGVTLTPTTVNLTVASSVQLTATVEPSTASDQDVTWSTSNGTVASVSTSGLVTGVNTGNATITVTTTDGNKKATCAVAVIVSHTYSDASGTMSALVYGIGAAASTSNSSASAYESVAGSVVTYHFNNYVWVGITLNGTLVDDMTSYTENGTITASGGNVTQIKYNNVTTNTAGGTLEITFTDSSTWVYNYATQTFTLK